MSAATQKSKKQRVKTPRSRPLGASSISQPVVEGAWLSTVLSAFSPDAQLFAFLSLAVDKHRLRVFDASSSHSIAEHIVDRTQVSSLAWVPFDTSDKNIGEKEASPSKKRKKLDTTAGISNQDVNLPTKGKAVALGLSDGSVQIFSAVHGRIVRTLSHATSKSPILAIAEGGTHNGVDQCIWTSTAGGNLHLWDVSKGEILVSTQSKGGTPYSALAIRLGIKHNQNHILAASNTIHLLSSSFNSTSSDDSESDNFEEVATFGGHASAVKSLLWDPSASVTPNRRFYSSAEDDRFVYIWEIPEPPSTKGKMAASCPLDADVRQIDVSTSTGRQVLLTLSSSGKVTLSPVPAELSTSTGTKSSSKQHVPTLLPRTTINLSKKSTSDVRVVAATFLPTEQGKIRAALVSGGAKVAFETLEYTDSAGEFIAELTLKSSPSAFNTSKDVPGVPTVNKRYTESSNVAVATGAENPHDPTLDAIVDREVEGSLNADLAELSLGQRLAARSDTVGTSGAGPEQRLSGSDGEEAPSHGLSKREKRQLKSTTIPAHSLTRTLIQALHAGDTSLLEACLTHSDETLVRNTITRLPSQLAVPLLTACVERLGRGARGNGIKGRGGGASAQKGMALVKWVRAVLTIHSGYLMTMPDLVARLSHLHSTLTTRLTLQDRLLSLSGRLDLVLAQVELRSSNAPAPLPTRKVNKKKRGKAGKEPLKYVEGESSDEEGGGMQAEVEEGDDDEGSVEDIELGGDSEEDSEEESNEESDSDEDGDDNMINGFVDDEAEEDYDEDESDDDSD